MYLSPFSKTEFLLSGFKQHFAKLYDCSALFIFLCNLLIRRFVSIWLFTSRHVVLFTRHSLVRAKGEVFVLLLLLCYPPFASIAKGEVFVLLYVFLFFLFFCSVNDFSTTRKPIHAKVRMQAYSGSGCVFSPFGGWRPPAGGKRGK